MSHNPIVDEIHEIRQQLAASLGNDIPTIGNWARQRDAEDARPTVSFPPRRPKGWTEDAAKEAMTPSEQTRRDLLAALAQLGRIRPEWRLGQTLANLATTAGRMEVGGVWDLEDEEPSRRREH